MIIGTIIIGDTSKPADIIRKYDYGELVLTDSLGVLAPMIPFFGGFFSLPFILSNII